MLKQTQKTARNNGGTGPL